MKGENFNSYVIYTRTLKKLIETFPQSLFVLKFQLVLISIIRLITTYETVVAATV